MGFGLGVAWSLAGACAHTGIDALRKLGSGRIWPADLVALVAVFDAVISVVFVTVFEGWQPLQVQHPQKFTTVMLCSSGLLLLSKLMYQKALHVAPLSLTVPYLSFTPAILVLVAYVLVGEVSAQHCDRAGCHLLGRCECKGNVLFVAPCMVARVLNPQHI